MMDWSEYEQEQIPQSKRSLWIEIILGLLIGAALAGAVRYAYADTPTMIAKDPQGNWIRLKDEPCPDAKEWMRLRKAEMFYQGKNYTACWRVEGGAVLVFDDNGDFSMLPVPAFQKDEGV